MYPHDLVGTQDDSQEGMRVVLQDVAQHGKRDAEEDSKPGEEGDQLAYCPSCTSVIITTDQIVAGVVTPSEHSGEDEEARSEYSDDDPEDGDARLYCPPCTSIISTANLITADQIIGEIVTPAFLAGVLAGLRYGPTSRLTRGLFIVLGAAEGWNLSAGTVQGVVHGYRGDGDYWNMPRMFSAALAATGVAGVVLGSYYGVKLLIPFAPDDFAMALSIGAGANIVRLIMPIHKAWYPWHPAASTALFLGVAGGVVTGLGGLLPSAAGVWQDGLIWLGCVPAGAIAVANGIKIRADIADRRKNPEGYNRLGDEGDDEADVSGEDAAEPAADNRTCCVKAFAIIGNTLVPVLVSGTPHALTALWRNGVFTPHPTAHCTIVGPGQNVPGTATKPYYPFAEVKVNDLPSGKFDVTATADPKVGLQSPFTCGTTPHPDGRVDCTATFPNVTAFQRAPAEMNPNTPLASTHPVGLSVDQSGHKNCALDPAVIVERMPSAGETLVLGQHNQELAAGLTHLQAQEGFGAGQYALPEAAAAGNAGTGWGNLALGLAVGGGVVVGIVALALLARAGYNAFFSTAESEEEDDDDVETDEEIAEEAIHTDEEETADQAADPQAAETGEGLVARAQSAFSSWCSYFGGGGRRASQSDAANNDTMRRVTGLNIQ